MGSFLTKQQKLNGGVQWKTGKIANDFPLASDPLYYMGCIKSDSHENFKPILKDRNAPTPVSLSSIRIAEHHLKNSQQKLYGFSCLHCEISHRFGTLFSLILAHG